MLSSTGPTTTAPAVAEEDGRCAVLVVCYARERFGADHEHVARASGLDERRGVLEGVEKAGAGSVEIDDAGVLGANRAASAGASRASADRV